MEERQCRRKLVECGCWVVGEEGADCYRIMDISDSGAFVATQHPLVVGTVIELQLFTPRSAEPVTVTSEVIWSSLDPASAGMGVRFLELDGEKLLAVRELARLLKNGG
ncbi:MAG: PilZ domain-containing protein [Geobacter sp.]|nr:PilZ domain-containing protein [Geobacter sp.]